MLLREGRSLPGQKRALIALKQALNGIKGGGGRRSLAPAAAAGAGSSRSQAAAASRVGLVEWEIFVRKFNGASGKRVFSDFII